MVKKEDFKNLSKSEMIKEYSKVQDRCMKLIGENAVLEAKIEQLNGVNNLMIKKVKKLSKEYN